MNCDKVFIQRVIKSIHIVTKNSKTTYLNIKNKRIYSFVRIQDKFEMNHQLGSFTANSSVEEISCN